MEENNPSDSSDPNYEPEADSAPPGDIPEPVPAPVTPSSLAPDNTDEINQALAELNSLRNSHQKMQSEVSVVKTMLYTSVILILVVVFYMINKTHNLEIKDMGTELMLLQNQASLNLGIGQKTLSDRVNDVEKTVEELKQRKVGTNHTAQLNQLEETVIGLNGSLSAVAPNNSTVQNKVNMIRRETEDLVETYRETITPPVN